jgi:hypothetical protein
VYLSAKRYEEFSRETVENKERKKEKRIKSKIFQSQSYKLLLFDVMKMQTIMSERKTIH